MLSRIEIRGGLLALSGVLIVILLIAAVTPGLPGELLLQSLRFHLVAAGLAMAVLIILLGARWRGALVLLVVLVAGLHGGMSVWDYYARRTPIAEAPAAQFRFLSFNVLNFNRQAGELVDAIVEAAPDAVLVMEAGGIVRYLDRMEALYPYRLGCEGTTCDIALFSRFPFEAGTISRLPPFGRQRLVTGLIDVDGQMVTIMGLHLSKPYFDEASWQELYHIRNVMRDIEGPMVVAGDFNAAAWTDPLEMLARDQALVPGPSMPATWPVRLGPLGVPIDNMFTRGNARILSLDAGANHGSNHRPLWGEIGLYAEE